MAGVAFAENPLFISRHIWCAAVIASVYFLFETRPLLHFSHFLRVHVWPTSSSTLPYFSSRWLRLRSPPPHTFHCLLRFRARCLLTYFSKPPSSSPSFSPDVAVPHLPALLSAPPPVPSPRRIPRSPRFIHRPSTISSFDIFANMAQLDFADPLPHHPPPPPQQSQSAPSPVPAEAYANQPNHPVHDLFSLLKGAFNAVLDLAPALVSQPPQQTSTTTTVTTITSSTTTSEPVSFTTLTTMTTMTTTSTSVVPLGPSDHGHRSCVDFIRRLLGAGGATELRINSLPVRSLCIEDGIDKLAFGQDTCAICLDGYDVDNRVRVLGCEHVFHTACIDPWLRRGRPTCPLCQTICC